MSYSCFRNKDQTAERERSYFASHGRRRCVIVVGDKPGDCDVTIGVAPDERCLKIGFFDHSHEHPHPDLPPLPPPPRTPETAAVSAAVATDDDTNTDGQDQDNDRIQLIPPQSFGRFLSETNSRNWMLLESTTTSTTAAAATAPPGMAADSTDRGDAVAAAAAATRGDDAAVNGSGGGGFVSSEDSMRIQGRPGSQGGGDIFLPSSGDGVERSGGGERTPARPGTAVEAEELLRVYGDRFDVVACGGHSMDLVTDFVRHFVGSSSPEGMARQH